MKLDDLSREDLLLACRKLCVLGVHEVEHVFRQFLPKTDNSEEIARMEMIASFFVGDQDVGGAYRHHPLFSRRTQLALHLRAAKLRPEEYSPGSEQFYEQKLQECNDEIVATQKQFYAEGWSRESASRRAYDLKQEDADREAAFVNATPEFIEETFRQRYSEE